MSDMKRENDHMNLPRSLMKTAKYATVLHFRTSQKYDIYIDDPNFNLILFNFFKIWLLKGANF